MTRPDSGTMLGRRCLVTGASSGIGRATALRLAGLGATVIAVARDPARNAAAAAEIERLAPGSQVEWHNADLSRLADVRRLAAAVSERHDRLDVLVNNAGLVNFRRELTADGLDLAFAANHLGPFLLTDLVRPLLLAADQGRVIAVTSSTHRQVRSIPWDDLLQAKGLTAMHSYHVSKLLNVLTTYELARQLSGTDVTANCADPGFVHSGLGRDAGRLFRGFLRLTRPFQSGPDVGADTSVHLATSPMVGANTGEYFARSHQTASSPLSHDLASAQRLWTLSTELTDVP